MGFREKLYRFMLGRNGVDSVCYASLLVYILLAIVNAFVGSFIISTIMFLITVYIFFRILSKNVYKRRAENAKLLRMTEKFKPLTRRIKEMRTYRFRKCTNCKTTLRLPIRKGKHSVICPKCKNKFKVRIIF